MIPNEGKVSARFHLLHRPESGVVATNVRAVRHDWSLPILPAV
jgi:hypothetical protein